MYHLTRFMAKQYNNYDQLEIRVLQLVSEEIVCGLRDGNDFLTLSCS